MVFTTEAQTHTESRLVAYFLFDSVVITPFVGPLRYFIQRSTPWLT